MATRKSAISLLLGALTLLGCSDVLDRPRGDEWAFGESHERRETCSTFAELRCERLDECGFIGRPSSANDGRRYADVETCTERETLGCRTLLDKTPDSEILGCGQELGSQDCPVVFEDHRLMKLPRCVRREPGEACDRREHCLSGTCDEGTCTELAVALVGQSCSDETSCHWSAECVAGTCEPQPWFLCTGDCASELEVAEAACGSAIDENGWKQGCAPGSECMRRNDMGAGSCVPYASDGDACGGTYDSEGVPCQWPASCDGDDEPVCRVPGS